MIEGKFLAKSLVLIVVGCSCDKPVYPARESEAHNATAYKICKRFTRLVSYPGQRSLGPAAVYTLTSTEHCAYTPPSLSTGPLPRRAQCILQTMAFKRVLAGILCLQDYRMSQGESGRIGKGSPALANIRHNITRV